MSNNTDGKSYIGRFAPSPTGPLHLGSLYTALASYLDARANHGKWLLRIDDLDTPRNVKGASESIIKAVYNFGLRWDGAIVYQSENQASYDIAIKALNNRNLTYPCICTRKALLPFPVYPGYCNNSESNKNLPHALRIKAKDQQVTFQDQLQGFQVHDLIHQHGDFIISRKDNIVAYQLAVVIDDHAQNVSHVIRGIDLLDSTPKQIFLQHKLGYSTPHYCHIPVIVDQNGTKLSKQTYAKAVSLESSGKTLFYLLELLKQNPPLQLKSSSVKGLLEWAVNNWNPERLKNKYSISETINQGMV